MFFNKMKQLELCEEPIVNGRWFWVVCGDA